MSLKKGGLQSENNKFYIKFNIGTQKENHHLRSRMSKIARSYIKPKDVAFINIFKKVRTAVSQEK